MYLDYAKVFDRDNHDHLISTVEALGIMGPSSKVKKISNWAHLQVRFVPHLSIACVPFGVPQISLLGSFLFILFFNDIGSY